MDLVRRYQESFVAATPDLFKEMLQKYEVNYLVWDKKSNPRWQFDQYPFLKKFAEIGGFLPKNVKVTNGKLVGMLKNEVINMALGMQQFNFTKPL